MRWGFGWAQGPFETGRPPAGTDRPGRGRGHRRPRHERQPLPAWALEPARQGVHAPEGSYSARSGKLHARSALPVYRRQIYPERVFGEAPDNRGVTVWENEGVRLWNLPDVDPGVAILSVISKNHTLGAEVLEGILQAVARAERSSTAGHLASGSLRRGRQPAAGGRSLRRRPVGHAGSHGRSSSAPRRPSYAQIPTVAAVQGMALGGGCSS